MRAVLCVLRFSVKKWRASVLEKNTFAEVPRREFHTTSHGRTHLVDLRLGFL